LRAARRSEPQPALPRRTRQDRGVTTPPLSLAALTVLELSPPEMIACAAAAGYSHVGLRLVPATDNEPTWPVIGDTHIARGRGARLWGGAPNPRSKGGGGRGPDMEIFRLNPEPEVRVSLPALETGARLGARHVLVAGNDPDEARSIARFAALCELGAPLRLTV